MRMTGCYQVQGDLEVAKEIFGNITPMDIK
jgi:hypothetical protein